MGYGNLTVTLPKKHNHNFFKHSLWCTDNCPVFTMALLLDIMLMIYGGNSDFIKKAPDNVLSGGTFLILLTGRLNYTAKHLALSDFGHVGLWVERMARGFGMKVIASSHHIKTGPEYASIEQGKYRGDLCKS